MKDAVECIIGTAESTQLYARQFTKESGQSQNIIQNCSKSLGHMVLTPILGEAFNDKISNI